MMKKVSVLIVARNEASHIRDCIESCRFDKEVIVIDDHSTDNTAEIAESLGAKVFQRHLNGDFGAQKTFAIEQAGGEWVFLIDADERCTPELSDEISKIVQTGDYAAYFVERRNLFPNHPATHGAMRPDSVCRLMPKKDSSVQGKVHETVQTPYPKRRLKHFMYHYTYDNWEQYFNKFNKYTSISAEKYREQGKPVRFVRDIILRPIWGFFKIYILNKGFLDGKMGWIMSVNHSYYTMIKYVKLYYLYKSGGKF